MYENHFCNAAAFPFFSSVIHCIYLAFNLGFCVCILCAIYSQYISCVNCDCCVSFPLVPGGVQCVVDFVFPSSPTRSLSFSLCLFAGNFVYFTYQQSTTLGEIVSETKYLNKKKTNNTQRNNDTKGHKNLPIPSMPK